MTNNNINDTVLSHRNVWIPYMTTRKLDKLLVKAELTEDDIELLKDFQYFLLTDIQSGIEKGFYNEVLGSSVQGYRLKKPSWLTNINYRLEQYKK